MVAFKLKQASEGGKKGKVKILSAIVDPLGIQAVANDLSPDNPSQLADEIYESKISAFNKVVNEITRKYQPIVKDIQLSLRKLVIDNFGFGDFKFRLKNGKIIANAKNIKQLKLTNAFIVIESMYLDRCSFAIRTIAAPIEAKRAKTIPIIFRLWKLGAKAIPSPINAVIKPAICIVFNVFPFNAK